MSKKEDKVNMEEELKYALEIMHNQVSYSETKNAAMIGFSGAAFLGLITSVEDIKKSIIFENCKFLPQFNDTFFALIIIYILVSLVISIGISLFSFLPIVSSKGIEENENKNLFFFYENQTFNSSQDLLKQYSNKYKSKKDLEKDLTNQILNLSKIANRKYKLFRWSLPFIGVVLGIIDLTKKINKSNNLNKNVNKELSGNII